VEAIQLQRWWLAASVVATLLANWAGGFSLAVTAVFALIYLTGVMLIGRDEEPGAPQAAESSGETENTEDTENAGTSAETEENEETGETEDPETTETSSRGRPDTVDSARRGEG